MEQPQMIEYKCPVCDTVIFIDKHKDVQGCTECHHYITLDKYGVAMDNLLRAHKSDNKDEIVNANRNMEEVNELSYKLDDSNTMLKARDIYYDHVVKAVTQTDVGQVTVNLADGILKINFNNGTWSVDDYYE
jgi:ribosomal protein S27AE